MKNRYHEPAPKAPAPIPHDITEEMRQQVQRAAGLGLRQEEVAILCDMSVDTLRRYYSNDLKAGRARANRQVAMGTFKAASGAPLERRIYDAEGNLQRIEHIEQPVNATLNVWWTKTQMGWSGNGPQGDADDDLTGVLLVPAMEDDDCLTAIANQQETLRQTVDELPIE